jgi:hypothetical protein
VKTFLIKVEDIFEIKGRGSILAPFVAEEYKLPKSALVALLRPDGTILETEAFFVVPFVKFSRLEDYLKRKPAYEILLKDLSKADVPIGTEIWIK